MGIFSTRTKIKLTKDEYHLVLGKRFGQFEIEGFLHRGQFSTVFKALDTHTNTHVALRVLHRNLLYNEVAKNQFTLKADVLQYLSRKFEGSGFVENVQFGAAMVDDVERPYCTSNFIDGCSVTTLVNAIKSFTPAETYEIVSQLLPAISFAHEEKIWFHEFSPENILVWRDEAGKFKSALSDVGVAVKKLPFQQSGQVKKSFYAPEENTGSEEKALYSTDEAAGNIPDEKSDIYALSALVYYMLNGQDIGSRKAPGRFTGPIVSLEAGFASDREKRMESIEEFTEALCTIGGQPSTERPAKWNRVFSQIAEKKRNEQLMPSEQEVIFKGRNETDHNKLIWAVSIIAVLSGIAMLFGKSLSPLLTSPKKLFIAIFTFIGAAAVAGWYFCAGSTSGKLVISLEEALSLDSPRIVVKAVNIENPLQTIPLEYSTSFSDSIFTADSIVIPMSSEDVTILYSGKKIDAKKLQFYIRAQAAKAIDSLVVLKPPVKERESVDISLQIVEERRVSFTFSDPKKMIGPGQAEPEFTFAIMAIGPDEKPVTGSSAGFDDQKAVFDATGKATFPQPVKFVRGSTHTAKLTLLENSSAIFLLSGASAALDFTLNPSTPIKLVPDQDLPLVSVSLKQKTGAANPLNSLEFSFLDADGQPIQAVLPIRINGEEVLGTFEQGKFTYPVKLFTDFMAGNPTIEVNWAPFDNTRRWSKKALIKRFQIGNSNQFIIRSQELE